MNSLPLAFILGFFGSLHCAVMCGPLMLSMPQQKESWITTTIQLTLYQFGRILVYGILGLLVGAIGNSFRIFSNQQTLSFMVGLLLVLFAILHFSGRYIKELNKIQQTLLIPISKLIGKFYGLPFWGFFIGMLNGLIPCGMVYLALATALNTTSIKGAVVFMLLFGLGTTPLMLTISVGKVFLKKYVSINANKLMPWFMLFLGALMLLRSADLGIAFLSPNNINHPHQNISKCG